MSIFTCTVIEALSTVVLLAMGIYLYHNFVIHKIKILITKEKYDYNNMQHQLASLRGKMTAENAELKNSIQKLENAMSNVEPPLYYSGKVELKNKKGEVNE